MGVKAPVAVPPPAGSCSRGSECRGRPTTVRPRARAPSAMTPLRAPFERAGGIVGPESHRDIDVVGCGNSMQGRAPRLVRDHRQCSCDNEPRHVVEDMRCHSGSIEKGHHGARGRRGESWPRRLLWLTSGRRIGREARPACHPVSLTPLRAVRPRVTRRTTPSGRVAKQSSPAVRATSRPDRSRSTSSWGDEPVRVTVSGPHRVPPVSGLSERCRSRTRRSRARSCGPVVRRRPARPERARVRTGGRS